ncbi:DNA processing protein DprA [Rickettsia oklahomensis]|uniref:DNA processing protein DprA n=1 Tax=Rickettsia oklahomensis TaxID=3141789 RepID=A0AAU7BY16_9RICK
MLKELFSASSSAISYDTILRLIRSKNVGPKACCSLIQLFGDTATTNIDNAPGFSLRDGSSKAIKSFSKSDTEKVSRVS